MTGNICRVCGEGIIKLVSIECAYYAVDLDLYQCDTCGSEYSDHELIKRNIERMKEVHNETD